MSGIQERKRVVITGMGVIAPNGNGVADFEMALRKGHSGLRHQEAMAEAKFGCTVAGTPEGVDAIVDTYARGTQVTDLIFNSNASRSAIPSRIKQTLWDGYDPSGGDDQPFFAGTTEGKEVLRRVNDNFLVLQERGIDLYARWIDRSRALGRRAWLSIRMNDFHNVDEVEHAFHDRFWKQHHEYWRVPWREFEWPGDRALDYGHPAVREHHLAYARECIDKYDLDGLEVDWMRQPWCFAPGLKKARGKGENFGVSQGECRPLQSPEGDPVHG